MLAGVVTPQALLPVVLLDGVDQLVVATGETQVTEHLVVDGEESDRCPVFRGHVGDGRPIGHRHLGEPRAMELDELVHDAVLPQHLGDP